MTWSIEKITNNIFTNTKLELNLHELSDLMNRIRTRHKELRTFAHNSNDLEQITLQEFAQWTISHDTMAIQGLLDRIHLLVTGSDELRNLGNIGTFELLSNSLEVRYLKKKLIQKVTVLYVINKKVINESFCGKNAL